MRCCARSGCRCTRCLWDARIGTTSPRRIAQLRAHNPEFQFVAIRGNIDTRIRKLARGDCDALVLACAGLDRLAQRDC